MFFEKSGLARLSDLNTPEWKTTFEHLEEEQSKFISISNRFLSSDYAHPCDPLYTWSRCWEYPYIYLNIIDRAKQGTIKDSIFHILDVGSGVTFFPFSIASNGLHVTCIDNDSICQRDLKKAIELFPHNPGKVDFKLTDGNYLPYDNGVIDAIYCISVLEHILDYKKMIFEMERVLKPDGTLYLSFDLDIRGDHEIGVRKYYEIKSIIIKLFNFLHHETSAHPADILLSTKGPYGYIQRTNLFNRTLFYVKQQLIKPLLGLKPMIEVPYYLAVEGLALIKNK